MTRKPSYLPIRTGAARPNFLAALITCSAVGVLVLNFQLEPARAVPRRLISSPIITQIAPRTNLPTEQNQSSGSTEESASGNSTGTVPATSGLVCQGRLALLLNIAMLEDGIRWLEKYPGYTADFFKQEWLDEKEELTDVQTIEFKARHAPFSVYMHWLNGDAGREVLFIEGQNDDEMTVHAGGSGLKSKLTLNLDPHGSLAMGEARHPITQAGLLNLAKTMLKYRKRDLQAEKGSVNCCLGPEVLFDERPCYHFTLCFGSEDVDSDYRKSVVLIDKEWSIPVMVKNYGWYDTQDKELAAFTPEQIDEETFLEFYAYSKIDFSKQLTAKDFDKENSEYRF